MWTLECDGNVLGNKRIWLRPGGTYLFGRTLPERGKKGAFQLKDEKSVSRQHLILTLSSVKPGDGADTQTRSTITFKDEATKFGTEVNGDKFSGETKVVPTKDEHKFRLGKSTQIFRIKWHPVVFTFSVGSKEVRGEKKDLLEHCRSRLEDLDIKVLPSYELGATTHVVSSKRNTAKGLQALINGKYIVAESYIDALAYATTPDNLDELESLSPLEVDFDKNWPKPLDHLPAKSKEPSERPAEDFIPNPGRQAIFEGYTFVFCDQNQFENLQAPITNGGGKALEFPLNQGKTTTEEVVRYVKGVAGEKGLGEFEDGSEGKGVVVVAFRAKKPFEDWGANLMIQIALALGQRLIEQSEFLDAILLNDASILRRPLPLEEQDSLGQASSNQSAPHSRDVDAVEKSSEPVNAQPKPRRARARGPVISRFKGFDDDDDDVPMSAIPAAAESNAESAPNGHTSQAYQNGISQVESGVDVDSPSQVGRTQTNSRKRPAPSSSEDEDEEVDRHLPAAAALKRRRIEEEANGTQRNGISSERSFDSQSQVKAEKGRKPKKEINIKDVVRERRKAEEEAAKRDEENLRETLDGMTVEEMRQLAVVEDMEIPDRPRRIQHGEANSDANPRWDDRWNGRKNFKKFRRRGKDPAARRGTSVIVPLEEVKRKDYGIGEDYWLESERSKKQRKKRERATQSQTQTRPFTTARSQHTEVEVPEQTEVSEHTDIPAELAINGELPDVADIDAPRTTRRQERTQRTDDNSATAAVPVGKRKRGVGTQDTEGTVAAKKQKRFSAQDEDSDSEDDMKFRF